MRCEALSPPCLLTSLHLPSPLCLLTALHLPSPLCLLTSLHLSVRPSRVSSSLNPTPPLDHHSLRPPLPLTSGATRSYLPQRDRPEGARSHPQEQDRHLAQPRSRTQGGDALTILMTYACIAWPAARLHPQPYASTLSLNPNPRSWQRAAAPTASKGGRAPKQSRVLELCDALGYPKHPSIAEFLAAEGGDHGYTCAHLSVRVRARVG